jgi:PAS domain S-box-containing protein
MEKDKIVNAVHFRWVAIFCLVTLVYIGIGIFYYRYESQRIENDKYEDISAIAKLKADSIQEWRMHRLADVRRVPGPLVKREMMRLLQDPANPGARAALQIQLNINRKGTVYADALFLDTGGNILLSDNPDPGPVDRATMKAIEIALKNSKEVMSDFFRDPKGLIYIDAVAPVPDNSGKSIAIVVLRSKAADFLFPLIQLWPTPSKTAETLLVCRDGDFALFLGELRHRSNTALTLRFPLTDTHLPAVQAVLGKYGKFRGKDYRKADVLAVTRPIPESPWSIVAKVDGDEILAEIKYRAWAVSTIVFFLILISAGLIRNAYRNRQEVERKRAEEAVHESETHLRLLIEGVTDYAIYLLDTGGHVVNWNAGAERLKGYRADEIIGQHFSWVFTPEDRRNNKPQHLLTAAEAMGRAEDEGWRVRKDGSRFWANAVINALRKEDGSLYGFAKITRDLTERKKAEDHISKLNAELEQRVVQRTTQLEAANKELEAFSYSVSHDLRAPLRAIDGFSRILLEDYIENLDEEGKRVLSVIRNNTQKMGQLIDDLLLFSRLGRQEIRVSEMDMGKLAKAVSEELKLAVPERKLKFTINTLIPAQGDQAMIRQVFVNLLSNAVKFTRTKEIAAIEVDGRSQGNENVYTVKDNGVGFDMQYVNKLFGVFQRLHSSEEFEGTGVGLAIVQRIIHRHGGRVWAEGKINKGATIYFSLPEKEVDHESPKRS